jgi:hypothetical protein
MLVQRLAATMCLFGPKRPQDAQVCMQLYLEVVVPAALPDYDALVAWHTQRALAQQAAWRERHLAASGDA